MVQQLSYRTIYADPPWAEAGGGKIKRGADRHYALMKTKDIIALPVQKITAENAHLYLWVTNNFLKDGLVVMEAWGFTYKTTITWVKDRFGLGQYFRGQTEHCLFGVKGNLPYKIADGKRQQGRTVIDDTNPGLALFSPREEHSSKPIEMRKMIEKVSYDPMLELFAREKISGWDVWGNEVESDIEL
ncbi:MAG TPA: methyltransferase [candidate division CPR3 bacterium]|uniref:Methyltransferase n=1 Tax=candidate division CPR3 bacterium TaxID=2268181 RepID=A0A7C1SPV7_UNCC3|nr:methyltransferase [candidate division CPR3 bacterium]